MPRHPQTGAGIACRAFVSAQLCDFTCCWLPARRYSWAAKWRQMHQFHHLSSTSWKVEKCSLTERNGISRVSNYFCISFCDLSGPTIGLKISWRVKSCPQRPSQVSYRLHLLLSLEYILHCSRMEEKADSFLSGWIAWTGLRFSASKSTVGFFKCSITFKE